VAYLGVGIALSTSSRRQSKASRLWSLYDGSASYSFSDGTIDYSPHTLGPGSFVYVPLTDAGVFSGLLSGTGTLTKFGTGSIAFTNGSNWTGGLVINQGSVSCGADGALGSGTVTVQPGTTLYLNGYVINNTIVNNGGTVIP
jgi:hypothetical protein